MDFGPDMILFTPGPVWIDPARYARLPHLHHRTDQFRVVVLEAGRMLADLCGAEEPAFLLAASGTGAMEAVIANCAPSGTRVLVASGGKFGRRWAEIAAVFGCEVDLLEFEPGREIDPATVVRRARETGPDLLALTHVESSTGLRTDIEAITDGLGGDRPLVALDAIASVGSEKVEMSRWGVDLLAGAGQKALAAPAGVSFVIASRRAREAAGRAGHPRYYFSFERFEAGEAKGDTPFTPAVEAVQLLHESLGIITKAGPASVLERHRLFGEALRGAAAALGLRGYSDLPSCSVQAFIPPKGTDAGALIGELAGRYGILCAGGQGSLRGRIVRTGFPGIYSGEIIGRLVRGLAGVLGAGPGPLREALEALEPVAGERALF